MATVIEPSERINVVHIDGLVSLKKINFFLLKHTLFFYLDLKKLKRLTLKDAFVRRPYNIGCVEGSEALSRVTSTHGDWIPFGSDYREWCFGNYTCLSVSRTDE